MIRILFLAANPQGTRPLDLEGELADIINRLQSAEFGEQFQLKSHAATAIDDMEDLMRDFKPHIVHLSCHGSGNGELILETYDGQRQPVYGEALAEFLALLQRSVRCVVLNACYSSQQAQQIAEVIDCVIGMVQPISDPAAKAFSARFYRALAAGDNVATAFAHGCNGIEMKALAGAEIPALVHRRYIDPNDIRVAEKVSLFCIYSERDEQAFSDFRTHLHPLVHQGLLRVTGMGDVPLNQSPEKTYAERLKSAHLCAVLVSSKLLEDEDELYRYAIKESGRCILVPILIRPSSFMETSLGKFQVLPRHKRPIYTPGGDPESEWVAVVQELRAPIQAVQAQLLKPITTLTRSAESRAPAEWGQSPVSPQKLQRAAPEQKPSVALPAPKERAPASSQVPLPVLRELVSNVLPLDSDLQAFCTDYFPDVARRLSGPINRDEKVNVLFRLEKAEAVLEYLKRNPRFPRFAHLLSCA